MQMEADLMSAMSEEIAKEIDEELMNVIWHEMEGKKSLEVKVQACV